MAIAVMTVTVLVSRIYADYPNDFIVEARLNYEGRALVTVDCCPKSILLRWRRRLWDVPQPQSRA